MTDQPECAACAEARAVIETMQQALETATTHVQQVEQIVASRAALLSIEQSGRLLVFKFVRYNNVYVIETYSTMSDNVPGWKKELLE